MEYLCNYKNCEVLREMFPKEIPDIEKQYHEDTNYYSENPSAYYIVSRLAEKFGIDRYTYPHDAVEKTNPQVIFNTDNQVFSTLDIRGYNNIYTINNTHDESMIRLYAS